MRAIAALGLMLVSGLASAQSESQAYLVCGTVACAPHINAVYFVGEVTGIDDLNVRGDLFDVTFTSTAPASSPFVLSSSAAAPGQPLGGIDAANAISAVYGRLSPPYGGYGFTGDPGPAFITAFAPAGTLSAAYFGAKELWDVAETSVGGGPVRSKVFGDNGYTSSNQHIVSNNGSEVYYTRFTAIAAPEIDPNSAGSGLALLFGVLLVARGRAAARGSVNQPKSTSYGSVCRRPARRRDNSRFSSACCPGPGR